MSDALTQEPTRFRSLPNRGAAKGGSFDPEGGRYGAGLIENVAAITRGEALGHGMWVDETMLAQVAHGINQRGSVKARFTHPGMSSDGLGKSFGRFQNARVVGDKVLGDLHFSKAGRNSPDGDLGGYVMNLADEDPESFGMSIVFERDLVAEERFEIEHRLKADDDGTFASPDEHNIQQLPHARVFSMHAVDAVDEPAANPDGLFYRGEIPQEANAFLAFAFDVTDTKPSAAFGVDPLRAKQFVSRFLESQGLSIVKDNDQEFAELEDEVRDAELLSDDEDFDVELDVEDDVDSYDEIPSDREVAEKFRNAFGERGLTLWLEGKTFEEASATLFAELREENEELRKRVQARDNVTGEDEPVDFLSETKPEADAKPKGMVGQIRFK